MWRDLNDLNLMFMCLPLELKVRIRSLRFHYFMLIGDEEEVEWETRYLTDLYGQFPEVVVYHPITQYKMVTSLFLTNYKNNLSKVKELEELNQYYDDQKYQEIVTLLSETLDNSSIMTPSKDCSKTPNTTASSIRGAWCGWRQLSTLSWSRGPPLPLRRRRGTSRR